MTDRQKIIERWAKLRRLASDSSNPHESETARLQASNLAAKHCLSESELCEGKMSLAFDDLVDALQQVLANHPTMTTGLFSAESFLTPLIESLRSLNDSTKATRLRQLVRGVRTAAFIAGSNPTVKEVHSRVDTILRNHDIVL